MLIAAPRARSRWLSFLGARRHRFLPVQRPRSLSTNSISHLHPIAREFASSLTQSKPCFAVACKKIEILHEPSQFFRYLLDLIGRARRHIFLSSLYIGPAKKELMDALHAALCRHPLLRVYLVLDLNRSTRPGPTSTAHILVPLLKDHPGRVHISLFRSPKLSGLMAKLVPPRYNEGWGTWHAKIYGADDDIMISGANLNQSYFTNRQDRYIVLRSQPSLARYCMRFLETVSTFSFQMLSCSHSSQGYELRWPDPNTHPHRIQAKAEEALVALQSAPQLPIPSREGEKEDALIVPIIQAGQFNVREEEQHMAQLFHCLAKQQTSLGSRPLLNLTSGYFGLYKPYQDLILQSHVDCQIVAASPKANGFYGSEGVSGLIPEGYTLLEQRFMCAVDEAGRRWSSESGGVRLDEWSRDGWTYHAKGIWLSPGASDLNPVLSLFGSTNLNSRSANLDMELSFLMLTSSPQLRERLKDEVDGLRAFTVPWQGAGRHVRRRTEVIVDLVGGML